MLQSTELPPQVRDRASSRARRILTSRYPLRAAGIRAAHAAADATVAFVSLWVDGQRHVVRSAGWELTRTHADAHLCEQVVRTGELVLTTAAESDPRFADDELVRGAPYLRSYVGVPIVMAGGDVVGSLAIGDRRSRPFEDATIDALEELARVVAEDLEWIEQAEMNLPPTTAALDAGELDEHALRDEARQALLAAVSHELRTPLSVMVAGAQTLERVGALDGPLGSVVEAMQTQGQRLETLIDDILQVLDATAHAPSPVAATPLRDFVRATVWEMAPDDAVDIDVPDVTVPVDAHALRRALAHLVDNAHRHTPRGTPVEVRARVADGHVELTVSDDGPGIPPKLRDAVLRPFSQGLVGDPANPGLGIGLALVRTLVGRAGGQVHLGPSPSGGTSVRVLLPVQHEAAVNAGRS